jgi:hypothetical protein
MGIAGATLATFAVSGIIHDLVISWPRVGATVCPPVFSLPGKRECCGNGRTGRLAGIAPRTAWLVFTMLLTAGPGVLAFSSGFHA